MTTALLMDKLLDVFSIGPVLLEQFSVNRPAARPHCIPQPIPHAAASAPPSLKTPQKREEKRRLSQREKQTRHTPPSPD